MIVCTDCSQAQLLAGAIALGEAGDAERDAYRAHVAGCGRCLLDLGGEREIERVIAVVARARDQERWEPDLRTALVRRRRIRVGWAVSAVLAAVVLVVSLRVTERPNPAVSPAHAITAQEARALAALDTQTVSRPQGRAESLVVGATTVSASFEMSVDARGIPVRCAITKSSGDRSLDQSVCNAAMRSHYAQPSTRNH